MTIIHVNRQNIQMNRKDGGDRPVFTVKRGRSTRYAREVEILGPSKMVTGELSCGARAFLVTDSDVVLHGECSFAESRAA